MLPGDQSPTPTNPPTQQPQQQQQQGGFDLGAKLNQFGRWASDTVGLSPVDPVKPSYTIDYSRMDQDRAGQQDLLRLYQQMAAGQGPSLAQGQLQQATDQNISNAMALGAAQQGQGLGYASALRGIADQSAAARQQAAAQSAMLRNYEQMQAMGAQGQLLGQMGGQSLAREGLGAGTAYGYDSLNAQIAQQNQQRKANFFGGMINSAGGAMAGNLQAGMGAATGNPAAIAGPLSEQYGLPSSGPVLDGGFRGSPVPGYSTGGRVPGNAQGGMPMDSQQNDTVPAMLSPGEIVLPRSVTMAPDAEKRAGAFVAAVLARRKTPQQSESHPVVRQVAKKGSK